MARAATVVTGVITFAEMRAAFAKATRMSIWTSRIEVWSTTKFIQSWVHLERLPVDEPLVFAAGELASRYGLRGYDAVHLASALRAADVGLPVTFASFDVRLLSAASAEGLSTDLSAPSVSGQ